MDQKIMDQDSEKAGVDHLPKAAESDGAFLIDSGLESAMKSIMRRIDLRLVTIGGALYCVSLMDRTNFSAAAIAGMLEDLQLVGNRYVWLDPQTFSCGK